MPGSGAEGPKKKKKKTKPQSDAGDQRADSDRARNALSTLSLAAEATLRQ